MKTTYKLRNARITVNEVMSHMFKILAPDGDPLSPLIFALCIEPLAQYIRMEKIKGIEIAGENHKLSMYADDIITYLSKPEQSIEELMKVN